MEAGLMEIVLSLNRSWIYDTYSAYIELFIFGKSPSPVTACMTDVAPCGCLAAKFDSCNSLLSSVHTLLVNILRCVRLYIKRKYYILYNAISCLSFFNRSH